MTRAGDAARIFSFVCALALLAGCGKHGDFLYYLPQKDSDTHLAVNVKELRSAGGIDILWVIDNSPSMDIHQNNVIRNTGVFMQDFLTKKVSWKMGLVSTDIADIPYIGFDHPFDYTDPNPALTFGTAVSHLGTMGSGTEKTFDPILKALNAHPDFLRKDTPIAVLIVSDAPEQSSIDAPTFLSQFRATIGDRPLFVYPVLAATDIAPPGGCRTEELPFTYVGSPFEAFVLNGKIGRPYSICDQGFGTNLGKIGNEIVQQIFRAEIRLGKRPKTSTLQILFHGIPLPAGPKESGGLWYYDHDRNAIVFYNLDFARGDNESVAIDYVADDGLPDTSTAPVPHGFVAARNRSTSREDALADTWFDFDFKLESPHDYPNGGVGMPAIVVDGAKKMKLFFSRIKTEDTYDFVQIFDQSGKLIQEVTGDHPDGMWSTEIPGNRCSVAIRADGSGTDYGFSISKLSVVF